MKKIRIDQLLVEKQFVDSRSSAKRLIMAGNVEVNGQIVYKPGTGVPLDAQIIIKKDPLYVSRGGDKLAAALNAFNIDLMGSICADVGASTGGFTDCILQHGAKKVYAIDVGKGVLAWSLRNDNRVVVMEGINARYLRSLPEPVNFISLDVSFISIKLLLPLLHSWFLIPPVREGNNVWSLKTVKQQQSMQILVALIKPQFEVGKAEAARGEGVIRDPAIHRRVLLDITSFAINNGYALKGLVRSPLLGPKGNMEFFMHLEASASFQDINLHELIDQTIDSP